MERLPFRALLSVSLLAGCGAGPAQDGGGGPAFRVRSDFAAPLNSDQGWAGALNEDVTVQADRPFRVRFEVERPPGPTGDSPYRLQYRRNRGEWGDVEAHDFPHPERELDLDFASAEVGAAPPGWSVARGDAPGMTVAAEGGQKVLRVAASRESLVGLYTPPWPATELAAEFRLPADNRKGLGLVFGYVDAGNYGRVFLDPVAGAIRVSRFVGGAERFVTESKAAITPGRWLEIEVQAEGAEVEVNFEDDAVEFTAGLGTDIPPSPVGFEVPSDSTVHFREFTVAGVPRTPRLSIVSCPEIGRAHV